MGSDHRIMTPEDQEARWVAGESVHNGAMGEEGECCPDFSCCCPDLLWSPARREAFHRAGEKDRQMMLMGALTSAMASAGDKVHLAGTVDLETAGEA